MGFDLFGPAKITDIRVGYISTDRGYVQGATICEANSYAKLNPGTTFIIKNREKIEYKNINEVNELKPEDAFVPAINQGEPVEGDDATKCGGIQPKKHCGPVKVEFYGGGGVGAKGNPVIGVDGSLMAVHMVSQGNGYQYPPLVKIKDDCSNRGAGAVARVVGLAQTVVVTEVYSAEEEFEEYFPPSVRHICNEKSNNELVGHGRRYSPDGKDLGPWDPSMYVNDEQDPIKRQIAEFQEYLNALTDPWWFTRKQSPLQVTSDNEEGFIKRQKKLNFNPNRTVYPVHHWHWGGSLLTHGKVKDVPGKIVYEEEIFDIYTQGGHGRGLQFTFTEIGGDTVFVIKADDYIDGGEPRSITKQIKPNVDYKVTSQGAHGIRNVETGTEQGLLRKNFGSRGVEKGLGTSSSIFADLLGTANDNDDLQILAKKGKFKSTNKTKRDGHSNYDLTYRLTVPAGGTETASSQDATTRDSVEIARSFMNDHAISPVPMANAPGSDFAGMLFTMEWEEEFPYPGEYTFKAQCDNKASFYLDGQQEIPKIAYYKDKPSVLKKNLDWEDSDKKGKVYKMRIDLLNSLQYKDVHLQEPPQKDGSDAEYEEISTATAKFEGTTINDLALVVSGAGTAECTLLLDTNDKWSTSGLAVREMRCGSITLTRSKGRRRETLTGTGLFPAGRYPIEIIGASGGAGARVVSSTVSGHDSAGLFKREGISTSGIADTRIELDDNVGNNFDRNASINLRVKSIKPEKRRLKPPAKPKPAPTISGIKVQKVFNTVDWMNKANRQLWRTNVANKAGFINAAGVCPFNTNLDLEDNPYAGTHGIKWANVNFPIDGNYIIKAAVDDAVTLTFRGPSGETVIRKDGFDGGHSTGTSTYTRFFKKGNYLLQADLEQIPGGRFAFRQDKGKTVKDKEVSFKVTSAAGFANKITIPGLFSVSKDYKGSQINENFIKNVEVGKEYDVILTSAQRGTNFNSNNVRLRIADGGKRLQMEEANDADWRDIECVVTEGQFYGIQGNRCKFKLEETLKGINPMSLAVDIEVAYATKSVVSARSWEENPMGVAFTIKAPLPPTPIEEKPQQKGRCPNNPMWTTRFPANDKQWYPVRVDGWSKFLNRWAISPALPLSTPATDQGGKVFTNTWDVDIPYDGYYQLKGEVDDIARYYIDGDLKLDLSRRRNIIRGNNKFFLTQGLKKLKVEVENYSTITYEQVSKKVFSARDWRRIAPVAPPPSGEGGILCHAGGGAGGTDNTVQLQGGKVIVGQGGAGGKGRDDDEFDKHHGGLGGGAGLRNGGSAEHGLSHKQVDSMEFTMFDRSAYRGGPGGFGVNFQGSQVGTIRQIFSGVERVGGDGVAMGGGGGGNCKGGASGSGGNGGVKITWGLTGKSQEWTSPGVYNVTVPGGIGKAGTKSTEVPVTAKFEGNNIKDLALVVSGTGTIECTLLLDTNDNYGAGHSVTEMRCGKIILKRKDLGRRTETLVGTGTFVGGKRYPIQIIESGRSSGSRIVSSAGLSSGLFQRENISTDGISDTRIELDDDAVGGFDINASINLRVSSAPQPMAGVTIVCIGGGGSGFMDADGDQQGSGGAGGAYAWVNKDIAAGQKLKIVVGKGGAGKSVKGGERGGDSYVKVMAAPPPSNPTKIIKQQKGKVSYSGPNLFHFTDKRWGSVMNKYSVSPSNVDADLDKPSPDNVGTKILEWKNVDFALKGQYDVLFAADNTASLFINGEPLLSAKDNYTLSSEKIYDKINIGTPGRYDIKIELFNAYHGHAGDRTHANDDVFRHNPSGVVLEIRKDVNVATNAGKAWTENPVGVSGILVPPPCPKDVGGKGVVPDPVIDDPGNGYDPVVVDPTEIQYPVLVKIKEVRVTKPGINYDCSKDKMTMTPDLGYELTPICGPFGVIEKVVVKPPAEEGTPGIPPGIPPGGMNRTPEISIESKTGINAQFRPVFEVVVVPPDVLPPDQILQVTDLAGIKQTGYYNGKPYYGAVFYQDGIKYAGWYATAGQPIQIYDTLQESIDARVTTPPSAIQRQGSDVTSNDPRLNIPGTPDNLTEGY